MSFSKKFQNEFYCTCGKSVLFEIIADIECDWGNHTVIQCPNCEELFSIDCDCPAFQNISQLLHLNSNLFSDDEKSNYARNSHPL